MTKEMYEDLLERNRLQISELNTLTEEQDNHIVELLKENAELKKWKEDTIKARGNDYMAWSRQNDQLTNAKEIIKDLLSLKSTASSAEDINKRFSVRERAEQFLEGNEK